MGSSPSCRTARSARCPRTPPPARSTSSGTCASISCPTCPPPVTNSMALRGDRRRPSAPPAGSDRDAAAPTASQRRGPCLAPGRKLRQDRGAPVTACRQEGCAFMPEPSCPPEKRGFQTYEAPPLGGDQARRVRRLRHLMAELGVDAVLVPRADEHQGEYVAPAAERLAWLTGFTGSAG